MQHRDQHGRIDWPLGASALRKAVRRFLPKRVRLLVPTIPDDLRTLEIFQSLRTRISEPGIDVILDFSTCKNLSPAGIAYIGGLGRLVMNSEGKFNFDWNTCTSRVAKLLRRSGIVHWFGEAELEHDRHIIPYREDRSDDPVSVGRYLRESWLGHEWIQMTPALRERLVQVVLEIYLNAFEHGASPVGVISCGEHFPSSGKLRLSAIDFGVGIPHNVRTFKGRPSLRASATMRWAFQQGTTTSPLADAGRGIGLDLLKEFVRLNDGELRVVSLEGAAIVRRSRERFFNTTTPFGGTFVEITFRCDDKRYALASEVTKRKLFSDDE